MPDETNQDPLADAPPATDGSEASSETITGEQKLAGAVLGEDPGKIKRLANLKPWAAGQSGNPKGYSRRGMLSDSLMKLAKKGAPASMLAKLPVDVLRFLGKRPTMADIVVYQLMMQGITGRTDAVRLMFERMEGRAPADMGGSDDTSLPDLMATFAVIYADAERQFKEEKNAKTAPSVIEGEK